MTEEKQAAEEQLPPPVSTELMHTNSVLVNLLKSPEAVVNDIADNKNTFNMAVWLLVCGLICHAVFGFAIGLFGGLGVGLMAGLKAPLIALCSLALCLPSLYVFSCVGGAPLTIKQTFMLGSSCLAMIGFLLIGLAPVAWLFAVSTDNLPFVVVLNFLVWLIAVGFVVKFISKLKHNILFERLVGIQFWLIILIIVTLQMVTSMRPILAQPEGSWWRSEKIFFINHFSSCFEETPGPPGNLPE